MNKRSLSMKKNSTTDVIRNIKLRNTFFDPSDSFNKLNEKEVNVNFSSNRSSLITSCSTSDSSKSLPKRDEARKASLPNFQSKPKRRRVRFTQLEIVDIVSYKRYNKQIICEDKINGCSCIVF